jgi:hypothetical protein
MSKATMHLAYVAAGLTCQGAVDILKSIGTGTEDTTRLNALVKPMCGMAFTDGNKFLSDVVASTKTDAEGKASKEGTPDKSVKNRVSEVRQIYAAIKLVPGFNIDGLGYWKAYDAAKAALKGKGIRASGAPILTEAEKAEKAVKAAAVPMLAELMASDAPDEAKLAKLAEIKAQAAEQVQADTVKQHAERLVKAHGVDYCSKLWEALEVAILAADSTLEVQEAVAKAA